MANQGDGWGDLPVWGCGEEGMSITDFAASIGYDGERRKAQAILEGWRIQGLARKRMSGKCWRWWRVAQEGEDIQAAERWGGEETMRAKSSPSAKEIFGTNVMRDVFDFGSSKDILDSDASKWL